MLRIKILPHTALHWHYHPVISGSFNAFAFGEIKPQSGSLKDGRLDLVYYQKPGLNIGDPFPLWTLH
jgi:hypothetical protein